jgi:hypothetical protein
MSEVLTFYVTFSENLQKNKGVAHDHPQNDPQLQIRRAYPA